MREIKIGRVYRHFKGDFYLVEATAFDSETGEEIWIDSSDKRLRMNVKNSWGESQFKLEQLLAKNGVDHVSISTSEDYVKSLMKLFRLRS